MRDAPLPVESGHNKEKGNKMAPICDFRFRVPIEALLWAKRHSRCPCCTAEQVILRGAKQRDHFLRGLNLLAPICKRSTLCCRYCRCSTALIERSSEWLYNRFTVTRLRSVSPHSTITIRTIDIFIILSRIVASIQSVQKHNARIMAVATFKLD